MNHVLRVINFINSPQSDGRDTKIYRLRTRATYAAAVEQAAFFFASGVAASATTCEQASRKGAEGTKKYPNLNS
jgi:hypothetical protein